MRSIMPLDWGRCSRLTIEGLTMAQLQEWGQLHDLPPWVVQAMRNNESQGLLLVGSEFASSVIYLDDAGALQEVMIAD